MIFVETELVRLVYAACGVLILWIVHRHLAIRNAQPFYIGFGVLVAAYAFSVVEGVLMQDFFNLLEHGAYALAGLFFVAGLLEWSSGREDGA